MLRESISKTWYFIGCDKWGVQINVKIVFCELRKCFLLFFSPKTNKSTNEGDGFNFSTFVCNSDFQLMCWEIFKNMQYLNIYLVKGIGLFSLRLSN